MNRVRANKTRRNSIWYLVEKWKKILQRSLQITQLKNFNLSPNKLIAHSNMMQRQTGASLISRWDSPHNKKKTKAFTRFLHNPVASFRFQKRFVSCQLYSLLRNQLIFVTSKCVICFLMPSECRYQEMYNITLKYWHLRLISLDFVRAKC